MAPPTSVMALISLEDLEGLDDEQLEDDVIDNPEPMVEDDQLLSHWQAVASTHQVSVPQGVCMCTCSRFSPRVRFTLDVKAPQEPSRSYQTCISLCQWTRDLLLSFCLPIPVLGSCSCGP